MIQDFRFALRTLMKTPRFTAAAAITLALGIGANTAIFSVVEAVLLRPLPYRDPSRLVVVMESSVRHGGSIPAAPANFFDWRQQSTVFDSIAAAEAWGGTFTVPQGQPGRPEQIPGLHVTTDLFGALGVPPLLGRTFSAEDGLPGNRRVLVLSYRLWQRRFGGDPSVIGKTIQLTGENYTVLGVMPPGFRFAPFWQTEAEFWAPLDYTPAREHDRRGNSLRVFARLKPGVTLEQARSEMRGIARRLEQQYPRTNTDSTARVTPLQEMTVGSVRPALLILAGAVAFILLIACANVANLMLARATARRREIAVRLALGASRFRLIRQLLAESMLLAVAGGATGLLLAWWGIHALIATTPDIARFGLPRQQGIGIDGTVLAFTCLLSLATGVMFGFAPALQASKTDLNASLKEGGRAPMGGARTRLRSALVVSEIALASMLLAGAGLLIRSFQKLHSIDPGFRPRNVLTLAVSAAGSPHAGVVQRAAFYHRLVEQAAAIPGVQSASAVNHIPLAGDLWTNDFTIEGRPAPRPGSEPSAVYRVVLPDYFRTMGIALLEGRDFTERDTGNAPAVILINQALARRFWPGEDPLGKRMKLGGADSQSSWLTIVGVVRDVKQWGWADKPGNEMYLPYYQTASPQAYTTLVVRAAADPAMLVKALPAAIWSLDKDLPISGLASMEDIVSNSMWQPRFSMLLLGSFAAVALLLASVGIYGMMSYAVSQRTHEIGIRMALGARPRDVLTMVIRQGAALAAIGLALGLAGSLVLTRLLSSLLYQVSTTDPPTFAAISALLAAVALAASYLPARGATKVDPLAALRYE
ncbi:MAG TPA: ABC transporter permease [Bryobacterales bacterium]|nr:ABC transporter permease [Bryobacterales bacterium]